MASSSPAPSQAQPSWTATKPGACSAAAVLAFGIASLIALTLFWPGSDSQPDGAPGPSQASPAKASSLPLSFVPNRGHADADVRFEARGDGFGLFFARDRAVIALDGGSEGAAVHLRFVAANPRAHPEGVGRMGGTVSYLRGADPTRWRGALPTYRRVVYRDLWPGIDMAFHGRAGQLKYEFALRPGADPRDIRLAYLGAEQLSVASNGSLLVKTPIGTLTDARPRAHQLIGNRKLEVASRYTVDRSRLRAGFALPRGYDRRRPLVIDPGLEYSTLLGGSSGERPYDVVVDKGGNAYVAGVTESLDFPATAGAYDTASNGSEEGFVTKLDRSGAKIIYSTFLGGAGRDAAYNLEIGKHGEAYVSGLTNSTDFPTTEGSADRTPNGDFDAFVALLDRDGSALSYSTYFGGSDQDQAGGLCIDRDGRAYANGLTRSDDLPTMPGAYQPASGGAFDAYVMRLDPSGSEIERATYLAGSDFDSSAKCRVTDTGVYVSGWTSSTDFPATDGAYQSEIASTEGGDAYVAKLDADLSRLEWSTYFGGSFDEQTFGFHIDEENNVYIAGPTSSRDLPTTPGAFDSTNEFVDAYVAKLDASGSELLAATYIGGSDREQAQALVVDRGSIYVTGQTVSRDFPTTPDAQDGTYGGSQDAFLVKLDPAASRLEYSTFLGGRGSDSGESLFVAKKDDAYVAGVTGSAEFPTTPGAFDSTLAGPSDGFVTRLHLPK